MRVYLYTPICLVAKKPWQQRPLRRNNSTAAHEISMVTVRALGYCVRAMLYDAARTQANCAPQEW